MKNSNNKFKDIMFSFLRLLYKLTFVFKIKNNKIFFSNMSGKGYGDSPKYICEEFLNDKNYELVWALNDLNDKSVPKQVKIAKKYSLNYFYHLATSKIIINDARFPLFFSKRKKQFYIQTWHSPLRLKKIELDAKENLSENHIRVMKNDSRYIDLMISGCDFSYNIYHNSFMYFGKIEKCGTPRCDLFFDIKRINYIKNNLSKLYNTKDKKIILYVPTFRSSSKVEDYIIDYKKLINQLKDEYIFLIKLHPHVTYKIENYKNVIDVSKYSDTQELICFCDLMITDYSSCCFDALIANKPCILFIKDLDNYLKKERELYFDFNDLPFEKIKNEDILASHILNFDKKKYKSEIEKFNKKIGLYENGNACKKIKKIINDVMEDKYGKI